MRSTVEEKRILLRKDLVAMKKGMIKRTLGMILAAALALTITGPTSVVSASAVTNPPLHAQLPMTSRPDNPAVIPEGLNIDWNHRYTFAELEGQLAKLAETYPKFSELYSIGTSWQEGDLWCLEITNEAVSKESKTGIGVFANIHGGERESASSAMYTAWWLLLNSSDPYVQGLLDRYVIYVVPVINPDGYEQSFVNNNRPNLRPRDWNGDGVPFSDPYTDINGDGYIATIYRGKAGDTPSTSMAKFGMESSDWDKNGILGDDPRTSGIDMNRTFNYQWNRFDIETENTQVIGNNSWSSAGPDAASEPEIKALQDFLYKTEMNALTTLHTGIQCVLYPWCYRPYDANNPKDDEIPFMKETAAKMAKVYQDYTGRGFYTKSSYEDYPTSSEMIDYAYGRFNIHAYTIEVYDAGKSENGDISACKWEDNLPEATWVFYSQKDIKEKLKLDPATLKDANGKPLAADEGLWFYTSSTAQMVDKAPENQDIMVKGARDAILTMIESEPNGDGYQRPYYVK